MTMRKLNPELLAQNIEKRINEDIESGRVGGAGVKVMQNGEVLYRRDFGYSDCDTKTPLAPDTMFRLASMTKPITAAAILIQMGRGLIDLFDPIDKFLPQYASLDLGHLDENRAVVRTGKAQNKVRVVHLLTHSSGIGTLEVGDVQWAQMKPENMQSIETVVDYFSKAAIAFEPYTAQTYSPMVGFDVLARIIEVTSGMPYRDFVKKEIFEPLGMKDTTCIPTEEQWGRLINMHNYIDGKGVSADVGSRFIFEGFPLTYNCGGAAIASTVEDYSRFAAMLLNEGSFEGKQIIPAALVRSMGIPHLPETIMPFHEIWGLGVRVIVREDHPSLFAGTYGWSGAYGTHFWIDPENKVVAIYMKNSRYDGGAGALTACNFEYDVRCSYEN